MIIPTSYSYKYSHPVHLKTIAKIFGINAVDVEKAKILEIGSKIGMNLLPIAYAYPKAQFIGMEYSNNNINLAKAAAKELGLKNIEFKRIENSNLEKSQEQFDYIILHGILSQISNKEQQNLLKFITSALKDNGVLYAHYDTLPGCFDGKLLKDLLKYHTNKLETHEDKILQSRTLFNFFENSFQNSDNLYHNYLKNLQQATNKLNDKEFFTHYLEAQIKNPCYFFEFINKISKVGLEYLTEAFMPSGHLDNLPEQIAKELSNIKDKNQIQQYIDFITNRKFRSSILCKQNIVKNVKIEYLPFENFYFNSSLVTDNKISDIDIKDKQDVVFYNFYDRSIECKISSPRMKAIMYSLIENPYQQFSLEELLDKAAYKLKTKKIDLIRKIFLDNIVHMVLSGYINATSDKFSKNIIDIDNLQTPKALPLAKYQVEILQQNIVTNNTHDTIQLDDFEQLVIKLMDGINDKSKIISNIMDKINNGELNIQKEGKMDIEKIVYENLNYVINKLYILGLLI